MTLRVLVASLALVLCLAPAAPASAQTGPLRTVKLADGVYAVLRHNASRDPSDANSLVIVNERDVVVVDANIVPSSSRAVIAEIKRLTPKPVRYVVNTHYHSDHLYGNMAYQDAYPGVEFIAHPATRDDYLREDPPSLERNLQTEYPAAIERYRAAIARGRRTTGEPYTAADLEGFRHEIRSYEWFLAEMKGFRHVPPTLTVADSLVLHRGERSIVIAHLGAAHTRGDLVVYLPRERVLATGDVVVSPVPFAWEASVASWIGVLTKLKAYPTDYLLPGHGELQRDWSYVDLVREAFDSTLRQVSAAVQSDTTLAAVRARVRLDAFRERFVRGDSSRARSFDDFAATIVERAHREATAAPR